ncbi:MAG: histidinol-phosphate transaminase [Bdellovibrionales bacterium]|nr:histidinol-phosphate transaminase [Bdellovibrionales bacterium]NQZ18459.1 histidinol-phosphate transaminase [Bdellovibrionales bacterium]
MRVSPEIESLIPYKPGKPIEETKRELGLDEVIKLASNENALGPSPMAVEAIKKASLDLGRYPDPSCFKLRKRLATEWKVRAEDIVIGNGSNELIDLLIRVFCEPGDKIITPAKSFIAYSVCAQAARVGKMEITIDDNFKWDVDKFIKDFKADHNSREKILFIANPNNPTGTYLSKDEMDRLLAELGGRKDILVVIDEAYNEFVRADDFPSTADYFKKYPNVMMVRTFSKIYGLAGLRVGALIGNQDLTQWINRVRNPFNVNTLAQEAALAAMDDIDYIKQSQELVWNGLDDFYTFLDEMNVPYWKSQTNFVLFDSLRDGQLFFINAMRKGLLVRPMGAYKLPRHIRLSVGTVEENEKAKLILRETFKEVPQL